MSYTRLVAQPRASQSRPPNRLADALAPSGVIVTTLAQGVPMGGELDYLDDGTISAALAARKAL